MGLMTHQWHRALAAGALQSELAQRTQVTLRWGLHDAPVAHKVLGASHDCVSGQDLSEAAAPGRALRPNDAIHNLWRSKSQRSSWSNSSVS